MTNIMNLLSLLSGQQDSEEYKPGGAKFDPSLLPGEQGPEWSYPYRDLVEDLKGSPKLRMSPDDLLLQNVQDVLPVPPNLQKGSSESDWDPSIKYPYPNLWEEIRGRQEIASQKTGRPMISFPGQEVQESPAGFDPKDVDTLGVLSDIFSGKRTPFAGAFGGDPAPISRAYEARQARKTREAEREVWVEQMRSPTGEISDVRKDEIYRAKGLSRLGPKGERKAFIPADQPAPDKPDKEVKPTPEVEEGNKQDSTVNTDDHNIRGQANAINEWASGLDYDQRSISQQIADSLNVRMEDVSEQISQLRNQLKTELDRHVGWPELLIAFGMGLMGQNGVGYIRALEAHNRGRVAAVQTALDRARGLEGGLQDRWLNFLLTGQKAERAAGEKNISALEDILKREISDISAKEAGFQRTLGTRSDLGPASFKSTGGEDLYGAKPGPGVIEGGRRSKKMFSDMIKLLKSEPGVYAGLDRTKALKLLKHRAEIAAAKREARQKQKADK